MLQKIKNFLKRILPPPVRTFLREIERVLAEIRGQGDRLSAEVRALREEQRDLSQQLQTMREEISVELQEVRDAQQQVVIGQSELYEAQKQTITTLAGLQETQRQMFASLAALYETTKTGFTDVATLRENVAASFAASENAVAQVSEKVTSLSPRLEAQEKKLVELRERTQQHERNIISKIDREKQELFYEYYSRLKPEDYEKELALWYRKRTGKVLNLSDPKTYNEKIQWLKLYDSTPLKTRLADKYLVREWVKEKIGEEYLIPLLGVWDSFDEIDFDSLPNQFVLKANHGSGWNIIVKDKATFDKNEARKKFSAWMGKNYAFNLGFELHYMDIPPKIIAEEYLDNLGDDLQDYKVFCYDGRAQNIMVVSDRATNAREAIFDLKWNKQLFTRTYLLNKDNVPRPKNLDLLIGLSERLAADFSHVRVDFYVLSDDSIKFGEMTFTPASGICKWNPSEQDIFHGELIQLPGKRSANRSKLIH